MVAKVYLSGISKLRPSAVFKVEFIVLGLLARSVGSIFANLLSRVLLHRLDVVFHVERVATAMHWWERRYWPQRQAGSQLSHPGQKPLQVLRDE